MSASEDEHHKSPPRDAAAALLGAVGRLSWAIRNDLFDEAAELADSARLNLEWFTPWGLFPRAVVETAAAEVAAADLALPAPGAHPRQDIDRVRRALGMLRDACDEYLRTECVA